MMQPRHFLVFAWAAFVASCAHGASSIRVTFPGEGQKIPHVARCHVIGAAATNAAARLYLNGVEVERHRVTGAFLAMVRVHDGANRLVFEQGTNALVRNFLVVPATNAAVVATAASKPQPPPPPRNVWADLGIPSNTVARAHPTKGAKPSDVRIMVDAGHGGADAGALSPCGLFEKDFNRLQARAIADALRKAGFVVVETRSGDAPVALYDRPKRAIAEGVDAFVSIHHNAAGAGGNPREARHTVAYASNDLGLPLAAAIQRHVASAMAPVKDLGAQTKSLAVCRNPVVPSCLLEIDFVDLPEGEFESLDETRRARVAQAVVLGVLDWLALAPPR